VNGWPTRAWWSAFTLWHARDERKLPFKSLEQILQIQNRRVQSIVRHAYETVPHYREAMDDARLRPGDFRTAEDLTRLPLVTARDVARDRKRFRSTRCEGNALELHSSGTAGVAGRFTHDPASLFIVLAAGQRQREVLGHFIGRTLGYRELSVMRTGDVSAQMRRFYQASSFVPSSLELKRAQVSAAAPFERVAAAINDFRPDVIIGYGSHLGVFFRWAHRQEVNLFRPRLVAYGADLGGAAAAFGLK
jgi:phenylacetate-CoA ligase